MSSELSNETKIDILMRKYTILRQETISYIANFKAHVKYFQIFIGALIAFISISISERFGSAVNLWNSRVFWVSLMLFITTVVSYMVFDVIHSIYSMLLIGARLSILEESINILANERLLAWESSLSPYFQIKFAPVDGVWQPGYFLTFYELVLVATGLFALPGFLFIRFWDCPKEDIVVFRLSLVAGIIYSTISIACIVYCAIGAAWRIGPRARKEIRERTGRPLVQYLNE